MKRTIQVILFGLWALAASVSCSGNRPAAAPSAVGVWADRDCELLRTERFALLFESNGDTTTSLLQRMDATDTVLLGKTVFTPDSVLMQYVHRPGEARQYADPGAVQPDGRLRIVVEGRERMLEKIESFAVSAPYEMLKARRWRSAPASNSGVWARDAAAKTGASVSKRVPTGTVIRSTSSRDSSIAGPPAYGSTNAADSSRRTSA